MVVFEQTDRTAAVLILTLLLLIMVVGAQENARCEMVSVMGRE